MSDKLCPKNHNLSTHEADTHVCSVCLTEIGSISKYHCSQCNWNYCGNCVDKCGGRHKFSYDNSRKDVFCDVCGYPTGTKPHYYCTHCEYDICDLCFKMSLLNFAQEN